MIPKQSQKEHGVDFHVDDDLALGMGDDVLCQKIFDDLNLTDDTVIQQRKRDTSIIIIVKKVVAVQHGYNVYFLLY